MTQPIQPAAILMANPNLKSIPVIILTTSRAEADILLSGDLGANFFNTKPVHFRGLLKIVLSMTGYWLEIVSLPDRKP